MSGHSKWNNIKRTKGKQDAIKGRVFTKIGREIFVCVKAGGADVSTNSKLKDLIIKAKQNNMPSDTIERSIKKASGDTSGVDYTAMTYEGYGVAGSAVIVTALTDNKNRTAGEIRHMFDKHGGSLGTTGCVSYSFKEQGVIILERTSTINEDDVMMTALEHGAEDVISQEDSFEVYTMPADMAKVAEALGGAGFNILSSEVILNAQNEITLNPEQEATFIKMLDKLEDLDDVQNVYHNVSLQLEGENDGE